MDLPIPERWTDAAPSILPVIRRATEPAHAWAAEQADPNNRLIRRTFAPLLREMLVLDLPHVRLFLNVGHLKHWNVSPLEAYSVARSNLAEMATDGLRFRPEWGLWHLEAGDGYESSRLLLPHWLDAFSNEVGGRPIAAIPTQRVLLVGGDESHELLSDLALRAFREGGSPLSPQLYANGPDGPTPWMDGASSDLAAKLLQAHEYGEQAEQLAHDERVSEPLASIALHRTGSRAVTVATWPSGAEEALVPRSDVVQFEGRTMPFEHLQYINTDHDPPRFLVRRRDNEEQDPH